MLFSQPRLLWTPQSPAFTNIESFKRAVNRHHPELNLKTYQDFHAYSVSNDEFWMDLWRYTGVVYTVPPEKVRVLGAFPEVPTWFPGARLNFAENILRRNDDSIACTAVGESGTVVNYSFRQLRGMVENMAAALRVSGLEVGDRVAAIVTNSITAIILYLATASVGGIYTSASPDMGAKGILDRYCQIRPKFIFVKTEVVYAGKTISVVSGTLEVIQKLSNHGLRLAILLPSSLSGDDLSFKRPLNSVTLGAFLSLDDKRPLAFEQLPFGQPMLILYSSGTTGAPKCIVHSAGGILLQTMKDIGLNYGVGRDDTLLQYTTAGWMMWNLMVAGLAWGARLVLYDGSPFHPNPTSFLRLVHDQGVTVLGISPRFLAEIHGRGIRPLDIASFESLRTIASGGAVLTAPLHEWAQASFGGALRVMTAMGGTDICSSFVSSVLSEPVHAGEIPCKSLGMKVEVYDLSGNNIEHLREAGEMVCTRPHPSIPLYFWGDYTGARFRTTYFDTYPGVWRQGDFMSLNPDTSGMMILGRSDGVLNRGGIRFGTAEIYSIMEQFSSEIEDSICVGQQLPRDVDERILLFVKMRVGQDFSNALMNRIKAAIKTGLSTRHVPDEIFKVQDIPYTLNGKKVELAIKKIISGDVVTPNDAVSNPESFEEYYRYARHPGQAKL